MPDEASTQDLTIGRAQVQNAWGRPRQPCRRERMRVIDTQAEACVPDEASTRDLTVGRARAQNTWGCPRQPRHRKRMRVIDIGRRWAAGAGPPTATGTPHLAGVVRRQGQPPSQKGEDQI